MKTLTKILLLLNIAFWIGSSAICWRLTGGTLGWVVLLGLIIFIVSWRISCEVVNVPLENFSEPEWLIFIKKFKWSNAASLIGIGIYMFICIIFNFFRMRDFLNLNAS